MISLEQAIELCQLKHFANPGVSIDDIASWEAAHSYRLPTDMRTFYMHCDGASLFRSETKCPPFRLMRLNEICPARVAIFGTDNDDYGPASQFAFCDRGDGDYCAIELDPNVESSFAVIDCWHEAYPDPVTCKVIANSFTVFLGLALESKGNSCFWL